MKRVILFLFGLLFTIAPLNSAMAVELMTKEELKAQLGSDNLVIVDVRTGRDWSTSELKIKGAQRVETGDVARLASGSKDKAYVFYCA